MVKSKELNKHKVDKFEKKKKKKDKEELEEKRYSWHRITELSEADDNEADVFKDKTSKKKIKKDSFVEASTPTKKHKKDKDVKHNEVVQTPLTKYLESKSPKKSKKDRFHEVEESPTKKSKVKFEIVNYKMDEEGSDNDEDHEWSKPDVSTLINDNQLTKTGSDRSPSKKHKKDKDMKKAKEAVQSSINKFLETKSSPKKAKKKKVQDEIPMKNPKSKSESVYHEMEAHSDGHDGDNEQKMEDRHPVSNSSDVYIEEEIGWSKDDVLILINNIESVIPEKDTNKFSSRVEKLNWDEIQFKNYSSEECKEKWKIIEKKVRSYRILREMVEDAKLWLNKPWSSFYKSQKKNRHPDMPKRPLTSFMIFYLEKKDKIKRKNPTLSMTELTKIVGNKFHELSDSKKAKYTEKATILREEYKEKMKQFVETHPNDSAIIGLKNKTLIARNEMPGPQKPLPPVKLYIKEKMKDYDGTLELSKTEFIQQVKDTWKSLSNKKKAPWIRWANENGTKYLEELEVYKSQNPNFEMPKIKSILSKDEISILERMDGKPEKPPNSAYSLFSRLLLKDDQMQFISCSPKERMKEISRLWADVSEEEKKQYAEKAKHLLEMYKLDYANYLDSLSEQKRQEELAKSQTRKKRKKVIKDVDMETGKKLKQTKLEESFKNTVKAAGEEKGNISKQVKESKNIPPQSSDDESDSSASEEDDDDDDDDDEEVLDNPEKLNELKQRIEQSEPKKPPNDPFTLFKQIYMTNPGNKESKARMVWDSMPEKEKDHYKKKLDAQKQNYILKFKEYLRSLKPSELKVYSMTRNISANLNLSFGAEGESSEEESSDSDNELDNHEKSQVKVMKSVPSQDDDESSTSTSEESD